MRILVISGRFPVKGGRGDQSRLFLLLEQLSRRHEITLVAGERPPADHDALEPVHTMAFEAGRRRRALSTAAAALRSQPGQTGWMMPTAVWQRALDLARNADVALAVTSRSLRGPLHIPLVIDHVDALSFNMASRASGPESTIRRAAARFEARRMKAWEARIAGWADAQIASSDEVAELLPPYPSVTVIPAAWDGPTFRDPPHHVRDIDVIFTGDMSYPPNTAAARWLADEILPLVRAKRGCTGWVVGRHADRLELSGVNTAANVPDLHSYLKRAKVAVAPVHGRGSPFKTLEAAACGAALVATRWSVACYGLDAQIAETAEEFANGIVGLLENPAVRLRQTVEAQVGVDRHRSDRIAERFERVLQGVTADIHRPGLG